MGRGVALVLVGLCPLLSGGDVLGKPPNYLSLFMQLQRKTDLPTHLPHRVVRKPHELTHTLDQLTCTENCKPHVVQSSGSKIVTKVDRIPVLRELILVRDKDQSSTGTYYIYEV